MRIYDWVNRLLEEGRNIAPDTMSANLLVRLLRGATDIGGDRRAILAALALDEAALRNPLSRLSSHVALHFLSTLERHFGDPAVLLRVGEKAAMQNFSDLGYATRLEANLAAVIQANVSIQMLRQNMFVTTLDLTEKPPSLIWRCHSDYMARYAPFIELSVATYARLSRQILSEPALLRAVDFQHPPRFAVEKYEAAFGCPVRFSMPQTRMEIAARQLFRPSPHAHPALLEAATYRYRQPAEWMASRKTHLANSYFYLSNAADKSPPTLDRMAASFGMSERTLRRKLVEEGLPFRDLLDRVRQDLCTLYFLEDKRSLGEIALLLGYSDLSAFTRAYKRWHGIAPSK
ncbi:MAG TPA: AraC family transcriptional regulator ligand-binding domain-containing protein, partial [Sphingorhabdus sp.]|nr:AraC family transcriptional regulator ligand-binding domain-containing protein [Sphingorhabdus sp.]